MLTGKLSADWADYPIQFREDVHQLLAWSYADNRHRLRSAKDEYEMTGLLADGMESRIDSDDTPLRYSHYSVHNEKPTSPRGELGKKRPRLDIHIVRGGERPRPALTFEAKRLRDDDTTSAHSTLRQYLGSEGLGRFLSERYPTGFGEVGMLGLIQSHNANFWFAHLRDRFENDLQNGGAALALLEPLVEFVVNVDLPDEHLSRHRAASGAQIRVLHLFIDCS